MDTSDWSEWKKFAKGVDLLHKRFAGHVEVWPIVTPKAILNDAGEVKELINRVGMVLECPNCIEHLDAKTLESWGWGIDGEQAAYNFNREGMRYE